MATLDRQSWLTLSDFLSRTNVVTLQNEFYKPQDLNENNGMENIMNAILNQRSMAMDSGYVADVSISEGAANKSLPQSLG